jgi:hypothetical protein
MVRRVLKLCYSVVLTRNSLVSKRSKQGQPFAQPHLYIHDPTHYADSHQSTIYITSLAPNTIIS